LPDGGKERAPLIVAVSLTMGLNRFGPENGRVAEDITTGGKTALAAARARTRLQAAQDIHCRMRTHQPIDDRCRHETRRVAAGEVEQPGHAGRGLDKSS
jgi:hypothetical protein